MEDPSFDNIRESNFLKEAIAACKEKNVTDFRAAVTKLKAFSDMDKWRINMFTKVMESIEKESGDVYL